MSLINVEYANQFSGFGCSAAGMAAKLYIAEVAPPRSRGAWMGVLNSFYYVGQILASGIAVSVLLPRYGLNSET